MKRKASTISLEFEAFTKVDKEVAYAASATFNALFKINLQTGECTYIKMFQNEKCDGKRLYTKALFLNDKIYFVPTSAEEIAIFDIKTQEIKKLSIQNMNKMKCPFYNSNHKFSAGAIYGKYIFMIGSTYPSVLRINAQTERIDYFDEWVNEEPFLFKKSLTIDGSRCYVPSANNNLILCFDMESCVGRLYYVGHSDKGWWSMCKVKNDFWLAPKEAGAIICWNPDTYKMKEYRNYPKGFKDNGFAFTKIYNHGDDIFLIPAYANMGIKIALSNEEISDSGMFCMEKNEFIAFMIEEDDRFYLKMKKRAGDRYVYINTLENKLNLYQFTFANGHDNFLKDFFNNAFGQTEYIRESLYIGLEELIGALTS